MKNTSNSNISTVLIAWYNENKRDLPWRDITDPYKIWISEIILQQTRVNQGLDYYLRFINRFPDVKSMALASEDEVLKLWQGLGYYSRARNLHKAAKQIRSEFNGIFPKEYSQILSLSGIGEYTAAAIASFAYNLPHAVVDGNVYRFLSRYFAIETPIDGNTGKKEFAELAQHLLPTENISDYNQSIMEFGALQCVPVSPDCENCPLATSCRAFELNIVSQLPVKKQKTKVTNRFFNYLKIEFEGKIFIQKRTKNDIWKNLYEFPLIESESLLRVNELITNNEFQSLFEGIENIEIGKITNPMKHVLSHRVIFAQFISIKISEINNNFKNLICISETEIGKFAVSRLIELYLEKD